jgi:polyhydroxyalkanoate synthase
MGLIERIKSVLGLGTSASSPSQPATTGSDRPSARDADAGAGPGPAGDGDEDAATDDVDVTVEHEPEEAEAEPDTASEDAVKGTDTSDAGGAGVDLEEIKGIGPTYGDRLRDAGIADVAALADADPADLAERADVPEGRVEDWVDRAGAY